MFSINLLILFFIKVPGKTCDIAYEVFDCVADEVGQYCGQTPWTWTTYYNSNSKVTIVKMSQSNQLLLI